MYCLLLSSAPQSKAAEVFRPFSGRFALTGNDSGIRLQSVEGARALLQGGRYMKKILFAVIAMSILIAPAVFSAGSSDAKEGWEIVVVPKDSSNPWFVRMEEGVKEYQEKKKRGEE